MADANQPSLINVGGLPPINTTPPRSRNMEDQNLGERIRGAIKESPYSCIALPFPGGIDQGAVSVTPAAVVVDTVDAESPPASTMPANASSNRNK